MQAPTTPHPASPLPSPHQRRGWLLLALLIALAPISCGEEKKKSGSSGEGVDFTELREAAEGARDEAKAAEADKFATTEFEKGLEYLGQAEDFEEENASKAKQRYRSAKSKFEDALKKTKKNQSKLAGVQEELKKFEVIRDRLKEAGAEALVAEMYQKAVEDYDAAKESADSGDHKDAQVKLRYAMSAIRTAENQLTRLNSTQATADEERANMEKEKAAALAETAEVLAESDYRYATELEREATSAYDKNDFATAINRFRNARYSFESAAQYARDQKAMAAKQEETSNGGGIARRERGGSSGGSDAPDVGEIEKPEYTDSLDMSDLPSLFKGLAEADSEDSRILSLSWSSGYEFQEDVNILKGKVSGGKPSIVYEGDENVAVGASDLGYVFSGNTLGHLLIDCEFRDRASMKAKVHFLLLGSKPIFELVLMSDDGRKFYASEFATNIFTVEGGGSYKKPKARAAQPEYRKAFQRWVQKREPYELVFTYYKANDDEEGVLVCKLDGEETARFKTDHLRSGKIGFRWADTKFVVRELDIKGMVDEEWAKERLESAGSGGSGGGEIDGF